MEEVRLIKLALPITFVALIATVAAHPSAQASGETTGTPITEVPNEGQTLGGENLLPVKFYYEALCPDSRKMLADLGREYQTFKKYIQLDFVPFGRAKSLDAEGNQFECHHGPKECVANRIQSCGLKHLSSQGAQQQFVVCQMRTEADQTGKECFTEAGGDFAELSKCVDGDEGKKLQLDAEKETKVIAQPKLQSVPTVVFNDSYNPELQNKAVKSLKSVFCELLSDKKIPDCA